MNIEQYTDIKRYNTLAKKINEVVKELYNFEKQFNDYNDGIEELKKELIDDVGDSTQNFENIINNKLDNLEHYENEFNNVETKNIEQDKRLVDIEEKNKVQDVYMRGLFNENKDGRITLDGEGNSLTLECSKEGLATIDRVVGDTLVNLTPVKYQTSSIKLSEVVTLDSSNEDWTSTTCRLREIFPTQKLKQNTIYTSIINVISLDNTTVIKSQILYDDGTADYNAFNATTLGINKIRFTTNVDKTVRSLSYYLERKTNNTSIAKIQNWLILEGDYTNKPIPSEYFEGMQSSFENQLVTQEMVDSGEESVENLGKYRVDVKVRGKNLIRENIIKEGSTIHKDTGGVGSLADWSCTEFIKIDKGTAYCFSLGGGIGDGYTYMYKYDLRGNYLGESARIELGTQSNKVFTSEIECCIRFTFRRVDMTYIQLEEGTVATPYEPYYERTQTVYLNSPLHKGDEIVYADGELKHYHKMGEVVFNGSEGWGDFPKPFENTIAFQLQMPLAKHTTGVGIIADKIQGVSYSKVNSEDVEGISLWDSQSFIRFRINKSRLSTQDVQGFKQWLQANNVTVVYQLAEPYFEKISNDKLLLEIPNSATLTVESVIPCQSVKATYTGSIPSIYTLEETNANQDNLIDISLMATDEMYNMFEPLLNMIPQTIPLNSETKMVEFYYIMLIRKLKTIDEIPQRYKILVEEKIKEGDINVK